MYPTRISLVCMISVTRRMIIGRVQVANDESIMHSSFYTVGKKCVLCFLLWLILLLIPAPGYTQILASRPEPDSVLTKVSVGIHVINISKINDIEQVFTVDFALRLSWQDSRLVGKAGIYALSDVWHPGVVILNQHGINKLLNDFVTADTNGNVWYAQRFFGDLALKLSVRDFPFDTHTLPIMIASAYYTPDEIEFIADEYGTGLSEELSLAGWTVDREIPFSTSAYRIAGRRAELSQFDFELTARRLAGFYIWRVIVPLLLIIFMSWAVFFLDPRELESQITISVTSILTVIALQFTFVGILPKVSYLTRLDRFILGATILIFLALIESITTSALTIGGKHSLARRFDNWSRIVFPITLILFVVFSFWL